MLLTIDEGNTLIKIAVFEQNTLIRKEEISYLNFKELLKYFLDQFPTIENIIVSSVAQLQKNDFDELSEVIKVYYVSRDTRFPFENVYTTPHTLGVDRMILAAGAVLKFPDSNRLVIDAGTCITYDFIDENNKYYGGAISPGINLRYKSLHDYTAKLPLLALESPQQLIGNSTSQSIHSGVVHGVVAEIDAFINAILNKNDNFIIILTGGDALFLAERLKNTIFANPNFLLESLNLIFQFNYND